MSLLDMRTRTKADIRQIDIVDFFGRELPDLIDARGQLATPGAQELGLGSVTFETQSGAWTIALSGGRLVVSPGNDGTALIAIGDRDFVDMLNDITTLQMLFNLKRLKVVRGSMDDLEGWWAVLRSLVDARAIYTRGSIVMLDSSGKELDPRRSFSPHDDDSEIGLFLGQTGFLHLSGWLDPTVMAEIAGDMEREFAAATRSDGSWWATLTDGSECAVRISNFAKRSPALREVIHGEVFQRIARLSGEPFQPNGGGEAMFKPLNVATGISALPWHHDCALGMHSYKCCNLVVGISVTGAGPGSSQLAVLPGSHRALVPANRLYPGNGLEPVTIATRTGDLTVHCSCTMHMSENPTTYERKVVYASMELPTDSDTAAEMSRLEARYHEVGQTFSQDDPELQLA